MAAPGCVAVSEELQRNQANGPSTELAGRLAAAAWDLRGALHKHGVRNSNALIANQQSFPVPVSLLNRWAEDCVLTNHTAATTARGLPRTGRYVRALDLAGRAARRASKIYTSLSGPGAGAARAPVA